MADGLCNETPKVNFFPERGQRVWPACQICSDCIVRTECLDYAVTHQIVDGVWGGYGPKDLESFIRFPETNPGLSFD